MEFIPICLCLFVFTLIVVVFAQEALDKLENWIRREKSKRKKSDKKWDKRKKSKPKKAAKEWNWSKKSDSEKATLVAIFILSAMTCLLLVEIFLALRLYLQ